MSLVKDVERLGDYAKNLAEVRSYHPAPLPEGAIADELRAIRSGAEEAYHDLDDVFEAADYDRARALILRERDLTRRCDDLVGKIAVSGYDSDVVTPLVMATRFYKRTISHVLNVLSGVVMPLEKLDYYDERYLDGDEPDEP
jgi:phosphate uptake regulator